MLSASAYLFSKLMCSF